MVLLEFRWSMRHAAVVFTAAFCSFVPVAMTLSTGGGQSSHRVVLPRLDLEEKEFEYLERNGYVTGHVTNPERTPPGGEHFEEDAESAIKSFQEFYKLPVTGTMDTDTKATMWMPRCGFPDVAVLEKGGEEGAGHEREAKKRRRRYNTAGGWYKWDHTKLTYSIVNFPSRGKLKQYEVRYAIKRAFEIWSNVTALEFRELDRSSESDIRIEFLRGSHSRDKDHPMFDGPDGELAHAFAPNSGWGDVDGDVHFDDAEIFNIEDSENGYNFFQIAAHEIGHSLGLDHSQDPRALMWPHYHYVHNFKLPKDDVEGIQSLYGPNVNEVSKQTPKKVTSHCTLVFDAVTTIGGIIYAFKSGRFWEIADGKLITDPEGLMTDDYWFHLPSQINAVYHRSDGKTVFLKGTKYWVYHGQYPLPGYPRRLADLGLPTAVDAALTYNADKTFFIKKKQVWRFDEKRQSVDPGYPKKVRKIFRGLPRKMHSAFRHSDGQMYFLSGKKYYEVNRRIRRVEKSSPGLFTVDFMGCDSVKN
ncbi:neutrophil collagenase-like [Asterias rubens]|uniref:neutrophil collagenase-like n=1 Tax=Asterias rubens TaxID=7604 RepID=UPI00145506B4|nr:neutrophil collagenase-like [Asterias rubens]